MNTDKCREYIVKAREILHSQASAWMSQLARDKTLNLALQRKAERTVDKSCILQKIHLKQAEKFMTNYERAHSRDKEGIQNNIKKFLNFVHAEIEDTLKAFADMNMEKGLKVEIFELKIPEEMKCQPQDPPAETPQITSNIDTRTETLEKESQGEGFLHRTNRPPSRSSRPSSRSSASTGNHDSKR